MKSKDNKINNSTTTPANKGRNPAASYTGAKKLLLKMTDYKLVIIVQHFSLNTKKK